MMIITVIHEIEKSSLIYEIRYTQQNHSTFLNLEKGVYGGYLGNCVKKTV